MSPARGEKGQISIFFSASLVVVITIIAFVINIGLFVKAKINLQNATDSAAFAGASVQARQLTKIAYLNWEMRNIYKEWLYKYYVIGNLNIDDVRSPEKAKQVMKFNLLPFEPIDKNQARLEDKFNIPAVCIHLGERSNICRRYAVFGLPEFPSSNVSGAEESSRAFLNSLISSKVDDCSNRSKINMMVANLWTYNVLGKSQNNSLASQAPPILPDQQGAWPKAVELALRIRNLELIANQNPASSVCLRGSTRLTNCRNSIANLEQEKKLGNERVVKAFYSAYRNLGNNVDNRMKDSFTLTELSPKKGLDDNLFSASNLLIPRIYEKPYLDLKLMMVNYAIFYAAMVPSSNKDESGACNISKVAIPVPGYPLGFYKNPDVLTYYAVKGEAEFVGMFNPFTEEAVKLQAYSAAKPMGGRIGPMLFTQKSGQNYISARTDPDKFRSIPYLSSFEFEGVQIGKSTYSEGSGGNKFIPGLPIPTNSKEDPGSFWLEDPNNPVGGKLADPKGIRFGVPNLVYDYQTPFSANGYTLFKEKIHFINATRPDTEQPVGLYSPYQFEKFKGKNLKANQPITQEMLKDEIARVRAPTLYEASNYLIPTEHNFNLDNELDSFGFIAPQNSRRLSNGITVFESKIYAPLFGDNTLFNNHNEVVSTISDYIKAQETGMEKYLMSMNRIAKNIYDSKNEVAQQATDTKESIIRAAKSVSNIKNFEAVDFLKQTPETCESLTGSFLYFYFGNEVQKLRPQNITGCPAPLGKLLEEYYSNNSLDPNYNPNFYTLFYSFDPNREELYGNGSLRIMSAYTPGPFTGANLDGSYVNQINKSITSNMRRNFYSTKFISLASVQQGAGGSENYGNPGFSIHSEGPVTPSAGATLDTFQKEFKNPLDIPGENLSGIKY